MVYRFNWLKFELNLIVGIPNLIGLSRKPFFTIWSIYIYIDWLIPEFFWLALKIFTLHKNINKQEMWYFAPKITNSKALLIFANRWTILLKLLGGVWGIWACYVQIFWVRIFITKTLRTNGLICKNTTWISQSSIQINLRDCGIQKFHS